MPHNGAHYETLHKKRNKIIRDDDQRSAPVDLHGELNSVKTNLVGYFDPKEDDEHRARNELGSNVSISASESLAILREHLIRIWKFFFELDLRA